MPGVVNTLRDIQSLTQFSPFHKIKFRAFDIVQEDFANYLRSLEITHAACIIGTEAEEEAFMMAAKSCTSIKMIALAEKKQGIDINFAFFDFELSFRIQVSIAGSNQKRHVLILKRIF